MGDHLRDIGPRRCTASSQDAVQPACKPVPVSHVGLLCRQRDLVTGTNINFYESNSIFRFGPLLSGRSDFKKAVDAFSPCNLGSSNFSRVRLGGNCDSLSLTRNGC